MSVMLGNELGAALLTALGIDAKRAYSVTIICKVGEPARVEVGQYVERLGDVSSLADDTHLYAPDLSKVLCMYELVPVSA